MSDKPSGQSPRSPRNEDEPISPSANKPEADCLSQSETVDPENVYEDDVPLDEAEKALASYIDEIERSGKPLRIRYKKHYASVNGRRFYYDDDGRTVAPMKGVGGLKSFVRTDGGDEKAQEEGAKTLRGFDKKSARSFTCGALLAALTVAAVFIGSFGVLIWLLTVFWT